MKYIKYIKQHYLYLVFIILGLIDQNSDLLIQFVQQCNISPKNVSILRFIIIAVGACVLHLKNPKPNQNVTSWKLHWS